MQNTLRNHCADLKKSVRLQGVWDLLKNGAEYTTRDIILFAKVCAVSAAISELRANGKKIRCQRRGKYFYYKRVK